MGYQITIIIVKITKKSSQSEAYYQGPRILWGKTYRICQPGLLLVVENVGDAALVATSAGYSGKMMLETCEFIRVK